MSARIPLLLLTVTTIRLVSAVLFQYRHGALASYGSDIWYFICVARGSQHLFIGDPLQWVLPAFGHLTPSTLFYGLLVASNLLHLATVYLLFRLIHTITEEEPVAFWSALAYSLFTTSFNFSTASFHHQQVVLPILILLIDRVIRAWNTSPLSRSTIAFLCLLPLVAAVMGPDVLVILAWAGLCFLVRPRGRTTLLTGRPLIQAAVLLLAVGVFLAIAPMLSRSVDRLAALLRGIDLNTQRSLRIADLEPFGWANLWASYGLLSLLAISLLLWSGWRGFFPENALVIIALLFALRASRFYFVAEIGLALLLGRWLTSLETFHPRGLRVAGLTICLLLGSAAVWRGWPCFYPGSVVETARKLSSVSPQPTRVLCTPTYGFLIQGLTGARTTADWHHFEQQWTMLASRPAKEAVAELKKRGISHCLFTSNDFRVAWVQSPTGPAPVLAASGGFERDLPSELEKVEQSLVAAALSDEQRIPGVRRLSTTVDPASHLKTVLVALE
jgi:hypothetical protein